MKNILIAILMMVTLTAVGVVAQTSSESMMMMRAAIRLENQTDWFRQSLDSALDSNRLDGTVREDEINAFVLDFEAATDMYRMRAANNQVIPSDIERLLARALMIEAVMSKVPATDAARMDWMMVRNTLDTIAKRHNVVAVWTLDANPFWKTARIEPIIDRLDTRADEFEDSMDFALDNSKMDGTKMETEANMLVGKFAEGIAMLEAKVDKAEVITAADLDKVVQQGMLIDAFLMTNNLSGRVQNDWWRVKASLHELAMRSNIAWTWTYKPVVTKTVGTR